MKLTPILSRSSSRPKVERCLQKSPGGPRITLGVSAEVLPTYANLMICKRSLSPKLGRTLSRDSLRSRCMAPSTKYISQSGSTLYVPANVHLTAQRGDDGRQVAECCCLIFCPEFLHVYPRAVHQQLTNHAVGDCISNP